ncbi:MAG TPA: MMPL family transporter, partial [Intrasporangium sp.]|uniref:MMPL family transporter n=1 Tax=Intrasporangium sp. TaxID=1925024 RepID=UPI002B466900
MAEFLFRLGQAASRRAPRVIAAWFAVLLAAGIAFAVGAGALTSTVSIPGTRTAQVTERLEHVLPRASGGNGSIVLETSDGSQLTEAQRRAISERAAEATQVDGVATVVDPFQTEQDRVAQQQELDKGRARIEDGRRQLAAGRAQLEDGQAQLDAARDEAAADGTLDQLAEVLDAQQANLDAGRQALEDQGAQLAAGSEQIDQGARLLELSEGIGMVSQDGTTAIVTVLFDEPQMDVTQEQKDAVIAAFGQPVEGVDVSYSAELASGIPKILGVGEVIGILVAAVVLVIMLGTLIGAGLPILTALIGVAIGALFTMSLSSAIEMTSVTPVLGLMLGLAVGIDYSLFIINRHRRQLKEGYQLDESIGLANGTSGNAVVFAGATVLIALLALNVTGIPFLGLMGTVGALSIAIAVLIAITLTPALLGLIGERILSRRERVRLAETGRAAKTGPANEDAPSSGETAAAASASRLRPMSTRRAVGSIVLGIGALVAIALPALDLRLGLPDGSAEAVESTQYQAFSTVSDQ